MAGPPERAPHPERSAPKSISIMGCFDGACRLPFIGIFCLKIKELNGALDRVPVNGLRSDCPI
jgi:hypothetical protein